MYRNVKRMPVESYATKKIMNPLYLNVHKNSESLSDDFSSVTKLVRQKYFQHLQKTLLENRNALFKENEGVVMSEKDFMNIAQQIELKALNTCMVADLYRKEMLKAIKSIKDKVDKHITTFQDREIFNLCDRNSCHSNDTFMEENEIFNLSTINDINNSNSNDTFVEENEIFNLCTLNDSNNSNSNDTFVEDNEVLNLCTIKDRNDCHSNDTFMELDVLDLSRSSMIINEPALSRQIGQDDLFNRMRQIFDADANTRLENMMFGQPKTPTAFENKRKRYLAADDNAKRINNLPYNKYDKSNFNNIYGTKNFWRLEEYVQSAILQQRLIAMNDMNPRKYNKVMKHIDTIFGNGDVQMEALSPLDIEVLKYACKDRISHYVVYYLTTFYKKDLIKSKFLFKQLSRALVQQISQLDPYIDGALVWKSVREVFHKDQFIVANQRDLSTATNKILNIIISLS